MQLKGPQGPVVSVPVANHEVPLIERRGIVWLSVNYLPIRIGWSTTVLLWQQHRVWNLSECCWTSIMLTGFREEDTQAWAPLWEWKVIYYRAWGSSLDPPSGFHGGRAAFNTSPEAADWFVNVLLQLCTSWLVTETRCIMRGTNIGCIYCTGSHVVDMYWCVASILLQVPCVYADTSNMYPS